VKDSNDNDLLANHPVKDEVISMNHPSNPALLVPGNKGVPKGHPGYSPAALLQFVNKRDRATGIFLRDAITDSGEIGAGSVGYDEFHRAQPSSPSRDIARVTR
jgi:hypothetical protein